MTHKLPHFLFIFYIIILSRDKYDHTIHTILYCKNFKNVDDIGNVIFDLFAEITPHIESTSFIP